MASNAENVSISWRHYVNKVSLTFVLRGSMNDIPALVQIMARCRPSDTPFAETMMVNLLMHICVTRPQWVKTQPNMKKTWHGHSFHITDPLCVETTGELPHKEPVKRNFIGFFVGRLDNVWNKQSSRQWLEKPWRSCDVTVMRHSCIVFSLNTETDQRRKIIQYASSRRVVTRNKLQSPGIDMIMMTSSNGNIFRVTGLLCGEFTGPGEFSTQRQVTRSFDVFFDLRLNKRLSKQPWGWWFETPSWSLRRHCNVITWHKRTYICSMISTVYYRQIPNISHTLVGN